jgi:succinate-semialdehyde dehydrogenase/glutarate-semialdehyde dehydrogenase
MASVVSVVQKVQSLNPATGEVLAEFDSAGAEEVQEAVNRARVVSLAWQQCGVAERARYLLGVKDVLYRRREEITGLITREAGKPPLEALVAEVMAALDMLEYFARFGAEFLAPQRVPHHNLAVKFKRGRLSYERHGVIGIIAPSNYPLNIPFGEMAPALVAGNTVVLKPSELTPQIGLVIGDLCEAAGLPSGVVNVVLGDGLTGQALVDSAIDKLVFTGSVPTGKRIQAVAAERLLPTVLELGGKDPMIVCADADLETASSGAVWGAFTNAGQACLSVERLYVVRPVADRFTQLCVDKARRLRVGPGDDPATDVGPLIRPRQVAIVEDHVEDAIAKGAKVLAGGRRPNLPGFFYEPTVLTGVNHTMRIMRQETFGPVLPIMVVDSDEEAVALANDSEFGLSASVWTGDSARAQRLARQLHAGAVMVNDCISYFGVCEAPHGGIKSSGIGRSRSRLGLQEMVRVKYTDVDLVPQLPKLWWFRYGAQAKTMMDGFVDFLFAPSLARRVLGGLQTAVNFRFRR